MMGKSAGRSSGNRVGEGAERRNTPREREKVDAVREPEFKPVVLTRRGEALANALAMLSLVFLSALGAIIIAAWWGLI